MPFFIYIIKQKKMDHQLLLINRSAFPAGPTWLGTEFVLGDINYQVDGYAGSYKDGFFNKVITSIAPWKHPEVLKLLPKIKPSYILPIFDKRDLDRIFFTKEEAIQYWLHLGKYQELTIIKYANDDLYRIPYDQPEGVVVWQFDYSAFTASMSLDAVEVATILINQEKSWHDQ